jgi:hypothetical protein
MYMIQALASPSGADRTSSGPFAAGCKKHNQEALLAAKRSATVTRICQNMQAMFPTLGGSIKYHARGCFNMASAHKIRTGTATTSVQETNEPADVLQGLDESLRNCVAVLHAKDASIYVLGISHVSKESCKHIREVIAAVRPESVLIELCRDRTSLLLDEAGPPPQLWQAREVKLRGYTPQVGWPTEQELLEGSNVHCAPGVAVSAADIEDDVIRLLGSGLFATVRPLTTPPTALDAPSFVVQPSGRLEAAAPLGSVEFMVTTRSLPPINSLEIMCAAGVPDLDDSVRQDVITRALASDPGVPHEGRSAVDALMRVRKDIITAFRDNGNEDVNVTFAGVDCGRVTATIVLNMPNVITGLDSVCGGKGQGIARLQRQTNCTIATDETGIASSMGAITISADGMQAMSESKDILNSDDVISVTPWADVVDMRADVDGKITRTGYQGGISNAFADILTQLYAKSQAAAGRTVGISPGAAWREALHAAAKCGAREVLLGDMPASITKKHLAKGIWAKSAPMLLGAGTATVAGAMIVMATTPVSEALPVVAAAVSIPLAIALWPILAPLLEVRKFAGLTAAEIEECVRIKEPLEHDIDKPYLL